MLIAITVMTGDHARERQPSLGGAAKRIGEGLLLRARPLKAMASINGQDLFGRQPPRNGAERKNRQRRRLLEAWILYVGHAKLNDARKFGSVSPFKPGEYIAARLEIIKTYC
jgi:hypothetical protein